MNSDSIQAVRRLYVHVPFCVRKCSYCAFYSEAAGPEAWARFTQALAREMDSQPPGAPPRTVFFGGGTPSLLPLRHWEQIIEAMARGGWLGAREWSIECNPATVSAELARLWRQAGVNRISLGVQSLDDTVLERLGRVHDRAAALRSFEMLRKAGFDNLSIDLMFGAPGQTLDQWRQTLRDATALECEHLSAYEVTYEEGTVLSAQRDAGLFDVEESLLCAMQDELDAAADRAGFRQYEVSNYAREAATSPDRRLPGRACFHNVNYWRGGPYTGMGPAAHSFDGRLRFKNWGSVDRYCQALEAGQTPVESADPLCPKARAGEIAAVGLRMNIGWEFAEFEAATGFDLRKDWAKPMAELTARGWGLTTDDGFRLSKQGLRFADGAAAEFLCLEES